MSFGAKYQPITKFELNKNSTPRVLVITDHVGIVGIINSETNDWLYFSEVSRVFDVSNLKEKEWTEITHDQVFQTHRFPLSSETVHDGESFKMVYRVQKFKNENFYLVTTHDDIEAEIKSWTNVEKKSPTSDA